MKRVWIWVAAGLMAVGIALFAGVLIVSDFDLGRLDTVKYMTNSYDIMDGFESIEIDTITADIEFHLAEDGKCRVVCCEREKMYHRVAVENGILTISAVDSRTWVDHITIFNFQTPAVTVYLPAGEYGALKVDNTTGDVKLDGPWSFEKLSVETTTGDAIVSNVNSKGDAFIGVTTGDIRLKKMACGNLTAHGSTGEAVLKDVITSGTLRVKRTTGDICLDRCDAAEVYITATTGDVTGTFLTDKVISAEATTGDVDVPQCTNGGRCEVTTTTGDIHIELP